jgi:hypothetical protein
MEHELECPKCNQKFLVNEDYKTGDCPICGKAKYYWDYVLCSETYEELFSGYYFENNE